MRRVLVSFGLLGAVAAFAAASCGEALTPADCPGTPTDLKLDAVAPYWGGIVLLEFTVPDGVPDDVEIARYNADRGVWERTYGTPAQRPDDTFVSIVPIEVGEYDRDLEQKLRVRATLDGCPPSDWAESTSFKVTDPLPGTTWKAELEVPSGGPISIFANTVGPVTYDGPYSLDTSSEVSHAIAFGADGTAAETFVFSIETETPGDGYAGCSFTVHVASRYETEFDGSLTVRLTDRKLAPNAGAGSSCSSPPLSAMELSLPATTFELEPASTGYYGFDYTGLLSKTPGPAKWSAPNFGSALSRLIETIAVSSGADTTQVSANFYVQQAHYEKQ